MRTILLQRRGALGQGRGKGLERDLLDAGSRLLAPAKQHEENAMPASRQSSAFFR